MIFWILFGLAFGLFLLSFWRERRAFRNAVLLALSGLFLLLAITASPNDAVNSLMLIVIYGIIPLSLLVTSFVFISAGVITIKREGFSLSHSLSILFGIGIWVSFGAVLYTMTYSPPSFWLFSWSDPSCHHGRLYHLYFCCPPNLFLILSLNPSGKVA